MLGNCLEFCPMPRGHPGGQGGSVGPVACDRPSCAVMFVTVLSVAVLLSIEVP